MNRLEDMLCHVPIALWGKKGETEYFPGLGHRVAIAADAEGLRAARSAAFPRCMSDSYTV